jgi:AAA+ ATPase superfamily predicted ATPase
MAILNRVGPPVEGGDFFGREKELREANKKLDSGLSLLLSAPRRIGKSSFAKRLIEDKKVLGWKCVYIDLEEIRDENGFVQLIVNSFTESQILRKTDDGLSKGLSRALDKVQKHLYWRPYFTRY